MSPKTFLAFLLPSGLLGGGASAHEGHSQGAPAPAAPDASARPSDEASATTGSGDWVFRYRADLSELPEAIAAGIAKAHGGFAKLPGGEVFFGLEGTGLVRISPDLTEKTLVSADADLRSGGLHNTTYLDCDGGVLVLPDNQRGRVLVVRPDGERVGELGRPAVNDYYAATTPDGSPKNGYAPTDIELGPDGRLYVCDGYSAGKYVLTADLDSLAYREQYFGGRVSGPGREPGKFSTNHGVTLSPDGTTLLVADRERQWVQELTPAGEFVRGIDTPGYDPCDVDPVDYEGDTLMVVGCLRAKDRSPGAVLILRGGEVVSTLRPKIDLGLERFQHIHNAAGVVVDGKLFVLCYGWNPGCYAVLEHVAE